MRKVLLSMLLVLTSLTGTTVLSPSANAATTGLTAKQTGRIVSQEPARNTPDILDGTVYSITQVGNQIIVGGSFTQVQDPSSETTLTRNRILAFNATTGVVSKTFVPNANSTVYKVQAAADGSSVYVGGGFTSIAGAAASRLVKLDAMSGVRVTAFKPPTLNGDVRDLEVMGSRLWVAGKFTHFGGVARKALGTVNANTGAYDTFWTGVLAGLHNPGLAGSVTDVLQISSNAANTQLTAVGNFTTVNGADRSQIVKIDTSGATAALSGWSTNLFKSTCSSKFDTYMTDVEYSPDGTYFVVSTTGAYGGNVSSPAGTSGCDVVARFESGTASLSTPTWTAYTGGDTTWSVEVTDNVVYAGGHQRWQNNPTAGDRPGQGAVERTGIAALNPVNGMAYSWNPTRSRGVGVQDMLANDEGLYVGSDTTLIGRTAGNTYHARIALMPLSTGAKLPTITPYGIPAEVYTVGVGQTQLVRRSFSGTTATSPSNAPNGPGWSTSVGAFMLNGTLYTATSNGTLNKQTFDGTNYGAPTAVASADLLVRQTDWHDTDMPRLTSLFYSNGKIYFTRSDTNVLHNRAFEPESDIVGQQKFTTPAPSGISYSSMRGAFVAGGKFYYSDSAARLFRADWSGTAPVGGTAVQVSGLGKDTQNWASRAMFVYQGGPLTPPGNQAPTAEAGTASCSGLTCTFDGTGSSDPDGGTLTYRWDFGDGGTATTASPSRTYGTGGSRTVTLTVNDGQGGSATDTVTANPVDPPPTNRVPVADAGASCSGLTCTFDGTGSSDPDGDPLAYSWEFGDGQSDTGATPTHTYGTGGPRTVTLTVADGRGGSATDTVTANPVGEPATSPITYVASAATNGNREVHKVTIPSSVQAGDALVLLFTANTTNPTYGQPAGWTQIENRLGDGILVRAYTKVASAGDAGSTVSLTSSSYAKSDLSVAAYRGTDGSNPVASSASKTDASATSHDSPAVTATGSTTWLVTYWADKSSTVSSWTAPGSQTVRQTTVGSSTSHITGLLTDSNGPVPSGANGGLTATNPDPARSVSVSVLLAAG